MSVCTCFCSGVDTFVQTITFGSRTVKLYVWDTAGQERYDNNWQNIHTRVTKNILRLFFLNNSWNCCNQVSQHHKAGLPQGAGASTDVWYHVFSEFPCCSCLDRSDSGSFMENSNYGEKREESSPLIINLFFVWVIMTFFTDSLNES